MRLWGCTGCGTRGRVARFGPTRRGGLRWGCGGSQPWHETDLYNPRRTRNYSVLLTSVHCSIAVFRQPRPRPRRHWPRRHRSRCCRPLPAAPAGLSRSSPVVDAVSAGAVTAGMVPAAPSPRTPAAPLVPLPGVAAVTAAAALSAAAGRDRPPSPAPPAQPGVAAATAAAASKAMPTGRGRPPTPAPPSLPGVETATAVAAGLTATDCDRPPAPALLRILIKVGK